VLSKRVIHQNWCRNPTGLFIASCKKGVKAEKPVVDNTVNEWFTWARKQRIVIAMTGNTAHTPDAEPVSLQEIIALYPVRR